MMVAYSGNIQKVYVNTLWCYYLYQFAQYLFEDIDEIKFANLLNLRCEKNSIKIRTKEGYRFCYFLSVLESELRFNSTTKELWLSQILEATNINRSSYDSHYLDPVNKFKDNESNKKLVKELKKALEDIDRVQK